MAKITLNNVTSLQNEGSAMLNINNNSATIAAAVENTISRDGTLPNQMASQLDMNSNRIINLPNATTAQEPVTNSQAVRYDAPQTLTIIQQAQARNNIGASTGGGGGGAVSAVFGRTGAVIATAGDYTGSLVTNVPAGGVVATNVQAAVTELDTKKAPLASPTFTGVPAVPTATLGTNTTQAASTAFVIANAGGSPPVTSVFTRTGAIVSANGDYTASQVTNVPAGGITTATAQAALNELDTKKANLASPTFTGVPISTTPSAADNTTKIATTAFVQGELTSKANLASPTFTGVPAAPTAAPATNTTQIATTAFVVAGDALKADLASPTFTGDPKAPTAAPGDNDTSIATTAFVAAAITAGVGASGFSTGDAKISFKTTADTGWVMMNDGSIGNATSGGTTRANADTSALFTLLYASADDTGAPIQTSAGAATTRAAQGAAATAYAANCRLVLPRQLGRGLAVGGAGTGLTSRTLGRWDGAETHTQTLGEIASHSHTTNNGPADPTPTFFGGANSATINLSTFSAGSGTPMDIMNPRTYWNVMIKL